MHYSYEIDQILPFCLQTCAFSSTKVMLLENTGGTHVNMTVSVMTLSTMWDSAPISKYNWWWEVRNVSSAPVFFIFRFRWLKIKSVKWKTFPYIKLTLYQTTKFGPVQIEGICRRQNKCDSKVEICFVKSEKHCGKRRKCWLPAFSSFPTMFSKGLSLVVVKSQDCVVKS